jgi:hypothetical protein
VTPASVAAFSTAAHPPRTIRSARETCLPPVWAVEVRLDALEGPQDLGQLWRVVDLPVLLGGQADAGAVGAAALVVPRKVDADAQAVETRGDRQPGVEDRRLEGSDVGVDDQLVVDGGDRVLPDQLLVGDLGPSSG